MPINSNLLAQAYSTVPDIADTLRESGEQFGENIAKGIEGYSRREKMLNEKAHQEASDKFQVPIDDSDPEFIKATKRNAAKEIVNQAAEDTRQLRKGKIDSDEYKEKQAQLGKQIQQLNSSEGFLNSNISTFASFQDKASGVEPSGAMSDDAIAVQEAMSKGDIRAEWNSETRQIEYVGDYEGEDGERIPIDNIKVGDENAFPRAVTKVENPTGALLKNTIDLQKTLAGQDLETPGLDYRGVFWKDQSVQDSMDEIISQQVPNDNAALSIAVDHMGISKEEAFEALKKGELIDTVKQKLREDAKAYIDAIPKDGKIHPATTLELKQDQAKRQAATAAQAAERHGWAKDDRKKLETAGVSIPKETDAQRKFARQVAGFELVNNQVDAAVYDGKYSGIPLKDTGIREINRKQIILEDGKKIRLTGNPDDDKNLILGYISDPNVRAAYNALNEQTGPRGTQGDKPTIDDLNI